jgi:metal-responsive CopG/Arc/MetJ family transcriptional regulator
MMTKKTNTSFSIDTTLLEDVKRFAREKDISQAQLVRWALRDYIETNKGKIAQKTA